MANKFLMLLLLLGWGVSAQTVSATISLDLDKFTELVEQKDKKIEKLELKLKECRKRKSLIDVQVGVLETEVDSLNFYKLYYEHSKHVITPRIIARIEEMVNH